MKIRPFDCSAIRLFGPTAGARAALPDGSAPGNPSLCAEQPNSPQPNSLIFNTSASESRFAVEAEAEGDAQGVAGAAGAGKKLPRFSMIAYTGAAMRVGGWRYPVIVDLAGLVIPAGAMPIRFQPDRVAVEAGQVVAAGVVSRDTEAAREVVASARKGFPWQASVGVGVELFEFIAEDRAALVNGKEHKGPLNVVRRGTLGEISIVDRGADAGTSTAIAASQLQEPTMRKCIKCGKDLPADYQGDTCAACVAAAAGNAGGTSSATAPNLQLHAADADGGIQAVLDQADAEQKRRQRLTAIIAEAVKVPGADMEGMKTIAKRAIDEEWTVKDTELAVLRATRPRPPQSGGTRPAQPAVLAAAMCLACGIADERLAKDRDFGPEVVSAAWSLRRIGLHGLLAAALSAEGVSAPYGGDALYGAVMTHHIQAGWSTVNLPGILGAVANKILLDAFTAVDATYERIAQQAEFTNFHTHTIYRLDHTGEFAVLPPTGELKHGKLGETSSTNKLNTAGQILVLSRQAIINDDTNALVQLPALLGRKARISVEKALYAKVMEAADVFYTSGRGNKLTSNGLSVDALAAAEAAMVALVDADGDPVYAAPKILLVPPALKYLAAQLYTSGKINQSPASNKGQGSDNPFVGRFQVESSPFMALAKMTGYSASGWYLLADPNLLPAFQVAYLIGRRQPTIETADATFNTLGVQFRAYFDFGVAQVDYRGAVSSDA